jgi:uroporphyrinogen-III synthase
MKILVIREFDNFSRIFAANEFEIINLPLIETAAIDDLSAFENIENYDGVFLTSKQAAEIFKASLKSNYRGKIYVLGRHSYEILKDANLNLRYDKKANTAREMLENIELEELNGKRFLFVRGDKSLRIVPEFLAEIAAVDEAIVYETRKIVVETDKISSLREKFLTNEIAAVCFFSPSAAESFIEQFGAEILHQTIIATIGKTTAEFFETRNLHVNFVSSKATAEDFAVELIEYLTNGKRKMENGK